MPGKEESPERLTSDQFVNAPITNDLETVPALPTAEDDTALRPTTRELIIDTQDLNILKHNSLHKVKLSADQKSGEAVSRTQATRNSQGGPDLPSEAKKSETNIF